jgi:hypothetical protein
MRCDSGTQAAIVRTSPYSEEEKPVASVEQEAHLPTLDGHRRAEVGRALQATLVELVDLSLLGKQLHWNIVGRPFKPLHEHLADLVDSWRGYEPAWRDSASSTQSHRTS